MHLETVDRRLVAFLMAIHLVSFVANIDLSDGDLPLYQSMFSGATLNISAFKPGLFFFGFFAQFLPTATLIYCIACAIYLCICFQLAKLGWSANQNEGLDVYFILLASMTSFVTIAFSQTILAQGIACCFYLLALNSRTLLSAIIFTILSVSFHPIFLIFSPALFIFIYFRSRIPSESVLFFICVGSVLFGVYIFFASESFSTDQNIKAMIIGSLLLILYSYCFSRSSICLLLCCLMDSLFISTFFMDGNFDRLFMVLWVFIPIVFVGPKTTKILNIKFSALVVFICASLAYSPEKYFF